jgi:hypothetical protein
MSSAAETMLEDKLAAAAADATQIPAFLSALLDATIIVPGFAIENGGGQTVNLAALTDDSAARTQPFYTSEERLQETIAQAPAFERRFLAMRCRDLWEMTMGTELVLNPHSAWGKQFLPGEIRQLLDGVAPITTQVVDHPTVVQVGKPAHVPSGMEDDLALTFSTHPDVDRAYLGWKVTPETGDQSYLLVVVGRGDMRSSVNKDLGQALTFYARSHPVDVMYFGPKEGHPLTGIDPFYVKQKPRRFGRRG